jgi:hypothetical protein
MAFDNKSGLEDESSPVRTMSVFRIFKGEFPYFASLDRDVCSAVGAMRVSARKIRSRQGLVGMLLEVTGVGTEETTRWMRLS